MFDLQGWDVCYAVDGDFFRYAVLMYIYGAGPHDKVAVRSGRQSLSFVVGFYTRTSTEVLEAVAKGGFLT